MIVFLKSFLYCTVQYESTMSSSMQNDRTQPAPASRTENGPKPAIPEKRHLTPPVRVKGAVSDILLALAITLLPLTILTAVLLALVFSHRVMPNDSAILPLPPGSEPSYDSFYLVDFSATRLITVASWSSSVAPLLPGFMMTLLSYPAGRRILRASEDESASSLMTPFQLGLFINLLKGGIGPLWSWLKYLAWKRREKLVGTMWIAVATLLLSTALG
jgi:hypothetical protein